MLSPARRYNGQWYSRWLYIDVQLNVSSRRQSFDAAFEWWHGLELLMLVLEHHELKFVEVDERNLPPAVRWFLGRLAAEKIRETNLGPPASAARAQPLAAYATATALCEHHCDSCDTSSCCEHSHSTNASEESTSPLPHRLVGRGVRHASIGDHRYAITCVDAAMGRRP